MLSVPTEFWMLVRSEVTQREFAEVSFKQTICLTVGYASCTVVMSEEGSVVERPAEESSELHPDVMLVTTADRVLLEQGPSAQRPVNQLLIGSTMDEFVPPVTKETRADGLRQAASGEARTFVSAVLHPLEID